MGYGNDKIQVKDVATVNPYENDKFQVEPDFSGPWKLQRGHQITGETNNFKYVTRN